MPVNFMNTGVADSVVFIGDAAIFLSYRYAPKIPIYAPRNAFNAFDLG